jgi:hypothetical protein
MTRAHVTWTCLFFVATLLAGEVAMRASGLARRMREENSYIQKADSYRGADVVMTGDSRILHGFDPRTAEGVLQSHLGQPVSVFNAGMSGAPPMAQLAWVRRFLSTQPRPRLVLMGISPYMFSSKIVRAQARESLHTLWRIQDLPAALRAGAGPEELSTIFANDLSEAFRFRARVVDVVLRRQTLGKSHDGDNGGFVAFGTVPPAAQDARARGRGMAYRTELWPPATFGNEHMRYFEEALRSLKAANIPVIVVNTPSASQVNLAYGPRSLYPRHIEWLKATAAKYGARYFDAQHVPVLQDSDFVDGDHLSGPGAAKLTEYMAEQAMVPALRTPMDVVTAP